VLALAPALGACGGDDEPSAPATAAVTPADAAVFAEAAVRPEGDQQEALDDALSKLLNTDDPGGFVVERLDAALREGDAGITYSEDIEPWLGEEAGLFFTGFTDQGDGAFVAEVTDRAAAEAAIEKLRTAQDATATDRSYHGVEYGVDDDDTATGFVQDFLVAGTEDGLRGAIEASQGDSLADDPSFQAEVAGAADDSVATVYAEGPTVLDSLVEAGEIAEQQRATLEEQVGAIAEQPVIASLTAAADNLAAQAAYAADDAASAEESPLLRELPADAWLAFAAADLGEDVERTVEQQGLTDLPGFGAFEAQLESRLGVDLGGLAGWIGDVGAYASGTSIFGLGGALELETTDEAASSEALSTIRRALGRDPSLPIEPLSGPREEGFTVTPSDAPVQIVVVQREGRVVAGLGQDSIDQVFTPAETLEGSEAFGAATGALGDDYAAGFFLDFEPLLELAEGVGATDDPDYQAAKPYLDHLDYLITGVRREDDRDTSRVVLGLR
jgi:Protein of unknown function (DUF3352)